MQKISINFSVSNHNDATVGENDTLTREVKLAIFDACIKAIDNLDERIEKLLEVIQISFFAPSSSATPYIQAKVFLTDPFGSKEKLDTWKDLHFNFSVTSENLPRHTENISQKLTGMIMGLIHYKIEKVEKIVSNLPQKSA